MTLQATYPGLRVLDLSTNIAGPFAAMILGDLGADVIKVERPPLGDDTRSLLPQWKGQATVFLAVNRNKRSVVLDIKTPEGREALLKLAARADVVIESFPPGVGAELALTDAQFRACNPRVILCSISAFGSGPVGSKVPGYDALVQAVSGMMSFTGDPAGPTVRIAPSLLDLTTGMWGAIAIMGALARRTGASEGEHIQLALLDSAFTLMCHQVLGFLATGDLPVKLGSGAPSAAPYRVFKAADGEFMLATATDAQFARVCRALDLTSLAQDERFRTVSARLAARADLDALLSERFGQDTVEVWLQRLRAAGISAGRVNNVRQALESELTVERQLLIEPDESVWPAGMPLLRLPVDAEGAGARRPPPKLGEHSVEVLSAVGYDAETIARLTSLTTSRR
jgi:crotonobetainyl-CoA:carnitine CoA-transferase CaiB-like acyl-CoA transferase